MAKKPKTFPINEIQDPAELEDVDYDALRDNEEGEDPTEEVSLKESDFVSPKASVDVLEAVSRVVAEALKKPLGGPLVASQLRSYCMVSVEELEAIERGQKE